MRGLALVLVPLNPYGLQSGSHTVARRSQTLYRRQKASCSQMATTLSRSWTARVSLVKPLHTPKEEWKAAAAASLVWVFLFLLALKKTNWHRFRCDKRRRWSDSCSLRSEARRGPVMGRTGGATSERVGPAAELDGRFSHHREINHSCRRLRMDDAVLPPTHHHLYRHTHTCTTGFGKSLLHQCGPTLNSCKLPSISVQDKYSKMRLLPLHTGKPVYA